MKFLSIAVIASCIGAASFVGVVARAQVAANGPIVQEGTAVGIVLEDRLRSGAQKAGDDVDFRVAADVYGAGHQVLIPAGAQGRGKITQSSPARILGQNGKLQFTCDYVVAGDGTRVPLSPGRRTKAGRNDIAPVVGAAIFVSPLALLISGGNVAVNRGTPFTTYVLDDTPVSGVAPTAAAARVRITLKGRHDGTIIGHITGFDGDRYTVATRSGEDDPKASDIRSIEFL